MSKTNRLETLPAQKITLGRATYTVEAQAGHAPYALVGPRGGRTDLIRNVHDGLLRSIKPDFAGRVFTDVSGVVAVREA